jgi:hypothetical protein
MKNYLIGMIYILSLWIIKCGEEKTKACHGKNYKYCAHECCGLENLLNCKVSSGEIKPQCECKGEKRCRVE